MISEFHTTHLIKTCLKAVQLSVEGKVDRRATGALYTGLLVHEALRLIHEQDMWENPAMAVAEAVPLVDAKLIDENRPKSLATETNADDLQREALRMVEGYAVTFADEFADRRLIGCEVPVRLTLMVDGQPAEFASHIDLLTQDAAGFVHLDDWKTGEESPTRAFLSRNLQLGMYYLCVQQGSLLLNGEWVSLLETPLVSWIHMRYCMAVKRKTTITDEGGHPLELGAGEMRPRNAIVREVMIDNPGAIIRAFETRVRMARANFYPATPSEVGCHLCESSRFCEHFEGTHQ